MRFPQTIIIPTKTYRLVDVVPNRGFKYERLRLAFQKLPRKVKRAKRDLNLSNRIITGVELEVNNVV